MEAAVKQTTKYIIGTTLIRHRRTTEIYPLTRRLWRNVIDKAAANRINRIKAP
jgi:hypothetical protein